MARRGKTIKNIKKVAGELVSRILWLGHSHQQVTRNQQLASVNCVSEVTADTFRCTFFAQSKARDSNPTSAGRKADLERRVFYEPVEANDKK
jgi:hypothetical protein